MSETDGNYRNLPQLKGDGDDEKTTTTIIPATDTSSRRRGIDKAKLTELVGRINSIEAEREVASDVKGLLAEAKAAGFDTKAIRAVVRLRRQDQDQRDERQAIIDESMAALGDYGTTELGRAAIARASGGLMPPVDGYVAW
jgi:uncharacterized protein (UPF0335 family)